MVRALEPYRSSLRGTFFAMREIALSLPSADTFLSRSIPLSVSSIPIKSFAKSV